MTFLDAHGPHPIFTGRFRQRKALQLCSQLAPDIDPVFESILSEYPLGKITNARESPQPRSSTAGNLLGAAAQPESATEAATGDTLPLHLPKGSLRFR